MRAHTPLHVNEILTSVSSSLRWRAVSWLFKFLWGASAWISFLPLESLFASVLLLVVAAVHLFEVIVCLGVVV